MQNPEDWQRFYTLAFSGKNRKAVIVPTDLTARFIRIEVSILVFPRPTWYRAGWINQVVMVAGKPHLLPGQPCPMEPSAFELSDIAIYRLRFAPVPYLPNAIVTLYRSISGS